MEKADQGGDHGPDLFALVTGEDGAEMLAALDEVAPDLGRYIVEFGYGEVYSRPGLDMRERQIAAVSALAALGGAEPQLRTHLGGALRVGLTREEVIAVIVQCLPFIGFPRVLNAVSVAREVFEGFGAGGRAGTTGRTADEKRLGLQLGPTGMWSRCRICQQGFCSARTLLRTRPTTKIEAEREMYWMAM